MKHRPCEAAGIQAYRGSLSVTVKPASASVQSLDSLDATFLSGVCHAAPDSSTTFYSGKQPCAHRHVVR